MRTPPRILIVDDTPANVHILQARLAAHGYDIVTATDGEAALAAVKETAAGPDPARRHDAEDGRDRGLPAPAGRRVAALHPDHHGHGEVGSHGRRGGPRGGRRRVPDQAGGPARAGRPGEVHAADQESARHRGGPGGRAGRVEQDPRAPRRGAGRAARAARAAQALLLAPARRADRRGRGRGPAEVASPRGDGRVPRPPRIHRLRRDGRARGGDGGPPGVPRRDGAS